MSWPKRVLAAIELNDRFPVDAGAAAAVARGFGARLLVVTVVPSVQAPFWLTVEPNDGERARPGEARARLRKFANAIRLRPSAESRLLVGDPAEQIAAVSSEAGVGLTVMTLRPRGGCSAAARARQPIASSAERRCRCSLCQRPCGFIPQRDERSPTTAPKSDSLPSRPLLYRRAPPGSCSP